MRWLIAGVMRLRDRIAIVTGAGQGIGRGIALAFAREGARVMIGELKSHRVERTVAEIRAAGGIVAFLCSEHASWITGTYVNVDGGWVKGI